MKKSIMLLLVIVHGMAIYAMEESVEDKGKLSKIVLPKWKMSNTISEDFYIRIRKSHHGKRVVVVPEDVTGNKLMNLIDDEYCLLPAESMIIIDVNAIADKEYPLGVRLFKKHENSYKEIFSFQVNNREDFLENPNVYPLLEYKQDQTGYLKTRPLAQKTATDYTTSDAVRYDTL